MRGKKSLSKKRKISTNKTIKRRKIKKNKKKTSFLKKTKRGIFHIIGNLFISGTIGIGSFILLNTLTLKILTENIDLIYINHIASMIIFITISRLYDFTVNQLSRTPQKIEQKTTKKLTKKIKIINFFTSQKLALTLGIITWFNLSIFFAGTPTIFIFLLPGILIVNSIIQYQTASTIPIIIFFGSLLNLLLYLSLFRFIWKSFRY